MRHSRQWRRAATAVIGGLALTACGSGGNGSGTTPATDTVSVTASKTLSFAIAITGTTKRECRTETYRTTLPDGQPATESSHFCGAPASPGDPVLVQTPKSSRSLLVDVSATGCGVIRAGAKRTALRPLVTRCTTRKPVFRVTILPNVSRLMISGVPDVPVINFGRHVCKTGICITPLV